MDIVDRLRFDAIRCETTFSKGVAGNITEAADEIGRLRKALTYILQNSGERTIRDVAHVALAVPNGTRGGGQ